MPVAGIRVAPAARLRRVTSVLNLTMWPFATAAATEKRITAFRGNITVRMIREAIAGRMRGIAAWLSVIERKE